MATHKIKVGVFSPNDFRSWVRKDNLKMVLKHEQILISTLRAQGIEVIRGGDGFPLEDQIAWNTDLVRKQAKRIAQAQPQALILNQGTWTFPYDSRDAVITFMKAVKGIDNGVPRVLIFCYKHTQVPGLVAGMAVGGALRRIGLPYQLAYGLIDKDKACLKEVMSILAFYKQRADAAPTVVKAINALPQQKYVAFGGMSLKMATTTADVDQWAKYWGISYEALDQSQLKRRVLPMLTWSDVPGQSKLLQINDTRIKKSLDFLVKKGYGKFDFTRDKLKSIDKFIYQLAFYYAAVDILKEYNGTFCGIKCQDELSAYECTMCLATAFLSNDTGPDGMAKPVIPTACENDMDSALTQLWLSLLNGRQPAGFGDFRDVDKNVLAIVNCGQHPPYFFGTPQESGIAKLKRTEYMGQEIFYDAGGSSVRGRTPPGETITVARLARENLRYKLVATVMETVPVSKNEHNKYNYSWPIIKGRLPISGKQLIDLWPCNHLGFSFGDLTPALAEMAQRLDIGYKIYDAKGRAYYKLS